MHHAAQPHRDPLQQNFQAMAIPAIIATVCVALILHHRSASAPVHAAAVAVEPSEA